MRTLLAAFLVCSVLACDKKADKPSDASAGASGTATAAGSAAGNAPDTGARPKATPGGGFVTPPLGAADAIEPPAREIVPGMLVSAAKTKGAKVGTVDYLLEWRPDTELWINKELEVVSNLQVEYPAKDWEAVKAKWGKPTIDDDVWVGANWMAKLNGCANGPCGVTFVRSPMTFLEKTPVPPGALGNLRHGMTEAQIKAETGYAISTGSGSDNGFGWGLSVDYDSDDKLDGFSMHIQTGDEDDWLPGLTKLWGNPVALKNDKVWLNARDGWMVQFAYAGTLLRFHPMKGIAGALAKTGPDSVLALAQSLIGKPKTALAKAPNYDTKRERFVTLPNEYSLSSPYQDVETDDKDAISELLVGFTADGEGDVDKLVKQISTAWGPITKVKDESGDELQTITVDGLKVRVEPQTDSVKLTIKK